MDSKTHHHWADGHGTRTVLCNGKEVSEVIEANTEQGFYRVAVRGASGDLIIDKKRAELVTMTVRGKVSISYV